MAASLSSRASLTGRPVLIGVGGATSSGKSSLAARLAPLIRATILPQDDFALPESALRYDERIDGKDWDDPDQSIDYPRFARALQGLHDGLPPPPSPKNTAESTPEPSARPIEPSALAGVRHALAQLNAPVFLVDGFLLYYDRAVREQLDVCLLLRGHEEEVRQRREGRVYDTAEGTTWTDPPNYFPTILWPSYIKAHRRLFENGDVEKGALAEPTAQDEAQPQGAAFRPLALIETRGRSEDEVLVHACAALEGELTRLVRERRAKSS